MISFLGGGGRSTKAPRVVRLPFVFKTALLSLSLLVGLCGQSPAQDQIKETPITEADRNHWAFKPISRPSVPVVAFPISNPIDAFILERLAEKGLNLAPPADRRTLLRRLSFDLIGLPPTQEEITEFEADVSPLAYQKQVDRLLSSPQYGERAALFWLDLARFAETDGFEHDLVRKDAWQYRDWVIGAFNRDLSYDAFVRAQLCGDESTNGVERIATMFCLAGPDMPDLNDQHLRRHDRLNELTATVGSVVLGLQLGCAQCHDHKYDPLSQADFYRLRAVFEPAIPQLKRDKAYNVFAPEKAQSEARFWVRGDHNRPGPMLVAAFPRIADSANGPLQATDSQASQPATRLAFSDWLSNSNNPLFARVAANRLWQQHFGKGIFATPSDAGLMGVAPSHEDLLNWLAVEFRETDWSMKSLRRKIVTSETYRQSSHRSTPTGDSKKIERGGGRPTEAHRELALDDVWRKRLTADPTNELYSRYPRRRLEGEAIRDAILQVAGEMNLAQGGLSVMPPLPPELTSTLLKGHWVESKSKVDHARRSIYIFARRNLRYPLFEAFDRPDANESCPVRDHSTTAPQALLLLNSDFALKMSQTAATKAYAVASANPARAAALFQTLIGRRSTNDEQASFANFVTEQSNQIKAEHPDWDEHQISHAALADLALALLNSSEFVYLD